MQVTGSAVLIVGLALQHKNELTPRFMQHLEGQKAHQEIEIGGIVQDMLDREVPRSAFHVKSLSNRIVGVLNHLT